MTDLTKMSDEEVQQHIWEQRCPELLARAEALAEALEYVDGFRERLIMGGFSHIASRVSKVLARSRGEK